MGFEISRREVLNNLIRFKDSLLDMHTEGASPKSERTYKVLLNCKTGDMRFAKKIAHLESYISRKKEGRHEIPDNWKEIQIIVSQPSPTDPAHFEIPNLTPTGLEPLAWRVASETLDILNQKATETRNLHPEMLPEEVVLQDLSSIHISVHRGKIEDLPGWMDALSRLEAEQILDKKPIGTYLLREADELTRSIVFHVSEENALSIRPYLLTVVEPEGKISDILFLQTGNGWTLYKDDPNLKDPALYKYFSTPQELLHQFKTIAQFPLS